MKTLEDKIIQKVYTTESINTCTRTAFKIVLVVISGFFGVLSAIIVFQTLSEQKTLSMLEIFSEDREIIQFYINDVFYILYEELPKVQLFIAIICFTIFVAVVVTSLSRFKRFSNRIRSLIKFWFARTV